jgi:hypothetical protein
MIPLILLALGLGVALSAYELSPHARTRIDDYARAIREAHAAHEVADTHLSNAGAAAMSAAQHAQAADAVQHTAHMIHEAHAAQHAITHAHDISAPAPAPAPILTTAQDLADAHSIAAQASTDAGVDHAAAATAANQAAAKNTADAAKNAKTEAERAAAAQSAAKVLEREQKIATALASLGVGECGVRSYAGVTASVKDHLLTKLHDEGMTVTGDNPWNIETHKYGVTLRAVWDPRAQEVKLIATAGKGGAVDPFGLLHVTCEDIWKRIDPIMKEVIGT